MNEHRLQVEKLQFLDKGPFSFSIRRGECVGLSGRSGIGKSQLFRALTDLILSTGTVSLNGISRDKVEAPDWRTMVTLLPTDSYWWYDLVGAHFSLENKNIESVEEDLVQLGLPPEVLQWQVSRLSTGEKQRLALLRSLQSGPQVLLLDEPSSGLDPYHTELLEVYLKRKQQNSNLTTMWVSHDALQLSRVADRVLVMEKNTLFQASEKTG